MNICVSFGSIRFHSSILYGIISLIIFDYPNLKLMEQAAEVLDCLRIGRKNSQSYSETIRSFAITLHFYSPRAYKFVRDKFNKHSPNETTLRKWHSNCTYGAEPGVSKEALRALSTLANKFATEEKQLIVSISYDEMFIRRLVQWSDGKKKFLGHITYGQFECHSIPVARNALVFLLTAINADFSLPIAHHFVIALNAAEKASLINHIITEVTSLGVKVANITFDGLQANISACKILGASFDLVNVKPFFLNPIDLSKIHIFVDEIVLQAKNICMTDQRIKQYHGSILND